MTPSDIKISKEVTTPTSQKWISISASLDETDDVQASLRKLESEIDRYIKESSPGTATNGEVKVINRAYERAEALIADCKTLKELSVHKEYANKNPDVMPFYMNKLKELNKKTETYE